MSLYDIALVSRAMFCSILKLSCDIIRRYTVLYFLPKRSLLLPTNDKITGLVGSQNGTNFHTSVPISLSHLPTNLYTSVADSLKFRRLVEEALSCEVNYCVHLEGRLQGLEGEGGGGLR